jgi:hypothetical protein
MQQDASGANALTVVAPLFLAWSTSPAFGQPVRAYHFTAPRPARNLLSPHGTCGCLHRGSPGRPHGEPVQLGVGIPFGYQIGAKGAQFASDARKALLAVDLNNAFNTDGETTEHLPGCFCLGPAASPLIYMGSHGNLR